MQEPQHPRPPLVRRRTFITVSCRSGSASPLRLPRTTQVSPTMLLAAWRVAFFHDLALVDRRPPHDELDAAVIGGRSADLVEAGRQDVDSGGGITPAIAGRRSPLPSLAP